MGERKTPNSESRIENIKELIGQLSEFQSLAEFLDHVSLVMDVENDDNTSKVNLMTLHSRDWSSIMFLCQAWRKVFSNQRSLDEKGNTGLEEERRLAHVGITRAKKYLFLSYAQNRGSIVTIYNQLRRDFYLKLHPNLLKKN